MHFQDTPYLWPSLIATLTAAAITPYTWWHHRVRGAPALGALMMAAAVWSFCYTLELAGATLSTKIFWASVKYLGVVSVPLAWFVFAYTYADLRPYLRRRVLVLLMIAPVLTAALALTNVNHQLLWTNAQLLEVGGALVLAVDFAPVMWALCAGVVGPHRLGHAHHGAGFDGRLALLSQPGHDSDHCRRDAAGRQPRVDV